jgi:hypothetical protein
VCSCVTQDDAVERGFAGSEHVGDVQSHFLQSTHAKRVEAAPAVDEYSGEM